LLQRQNIRTIAGIPGGANLPMYDALSCGWRNSFAERIEDRGILHNGRRKEDWGKEDDHLLFPNLLFLKGC
jgi:hypothetical protein